MLVAALAPQETQLEREGSPGHSCHVLASIPKGKRQPKTGAAQRWAEEATGLRLRPRPLMVWWVQPPTPSLARAGFSLLPLKPSRSPQGECRGPSACAGRPCLWAFATGFSSGTLGRSSPTRRTRPRGKQEAKPWELGLGLSGSSYGSAEGGFSRGHWFGDKAQT